MGIQRMNPHDIEDRVEQLRYMLDDPELEQELDEWEFEFVDGRLDALGYLEDTLEEGEVIETEMIFTEKQAEAFDRIWKQKILGEMK